LTPSLDSGAEKIEAVPFPRSEAEQSESFTDQDAQGEERMEPDVSKEQTASENGGETTFSYDRLISKSTNPVSGIDYKRREVRYFHCIHKIKIASVCCYFISLKRGKIFLVLI
jgi:hypothetical protein